MRAYQAAAAMRLAVYLDTIFLSTAILWKISFHLHKFGGLLSFLLLQLSTESYNFTDIPGPCSAWPKHLTGLFSPYQRLIFSLTKLSNPHTFRFGKWPKGNHGSSHTGVIIPFSRIIVNLFLDSSSSKSLAFYGCYAGDVRWPLLSSSSTEMKIHIYEKQAYTLKHSTLIYGWLDLWTPVGPKVLIKNVS